MNSTGNKNSGYRVTDDLLTGLRPTRRKFISGSVAAGGMLLMTGLVRTKLASAQTPSSGGHYRLAMGGGSTTDTLNPAFLADKVMQKTSYLTRNTLFEIDSRNELVPELAESWEVEAGAKRWTLKIRKGVEFHNGKTLDADDVIYSINYHRGSETKSAVKAIANQISEIRKVDANTVVLELSEPNADLALALTDYHFVIVPKETVDWDSGVGTGGYILQEWDPGVKVLARRNPNYWKSGAAHFSEVSIKVVNDEFARANALLAGGADTINRVDLKVVDKLQSQGNVQIHNVPSYKHHSIPMRMDSPPFDDINVRMAMKYAYDREQLLEQILRGFGSLGNDHPIAPVNTFHAGNIPQRMYDPDKARFHIKKARAESHTFEYSVADTVFPGAVGAAELFKESAAAAGIKINIKKEPSDGYWSNVWRKRPFMSVFWEGRVSEDVMFTTVYKSGVKWNDASWSNARFDKLLIEARSELDTNRRRSMYEEMQRIVHDDGATIIPAFLNQVYASTDKIATSKHLAGNLELDGARAAERWWFKS